MSHTESIQLQAKFRKLKATGMTNKEIAEEEGVGSPRVHYLTRPLPGERICSYCCQPLQPRVKK